MHTHNRRTPHSTVVQLQCTYLGQFQLQLPQRPSDVVHKALALGINLANVVVSVGNACKSTCTHTATHCHTLPHTATHCHTLPTLPHTATRLPPHTAKHCHTLPHTALVCSVRRLAYVCANLGSPWIWHSLTRITYTAPSTTRTCCYVTHRQTHAPHTAHCHCVQHTWRIPHTTRLADEHAVSSPSPQHEEVNVIDM